MDVRTSPILGVCAAGNGGQERGLLTKWRFYANVALVVNSPNTSRASTGGLRGGEGKTVAVFGGGIAGLTVAHELCRRGWVVTVYEFNPDVGGFFRSARVDEDVNMPSEYSWHGLGPWYANAFDVMKQIPRDEKGSVYGRSLSRPINFGLIPNDGPALFDRSNLFQMTKLDVVRWGWLMLKTWTANLRSRETYSHINAAEAYRPLLSDTAWKTWRACFGPWVGSDWANVSLHQVGLFFRKQFYSGPSHLHEADEEGPEWSHGAQSGWLVLNGPSSEAWFVPWVADLEARGVEFRYEAELARLDFDSDAGLITGAQLACGESVRADLYALATNPFAAEQVLARTPELSSLDGLHLFRPLVQDGPHTQVSFRLAFSERIAWPGEREAVIISDSEYNLTLCPQEQVWNSEEDLGEGIVSLWTGTACVSKTPGLLYGLPLENCTKEQFVAEVYAQLARCEAFDAFIREANGGKSWQSFPLVRIEVWHEWIFSPEGIRARQPKWVNTTNTQPFLPDQRTQVPNLVVAGAHTKTSADVWSIEAAVESGRRACQVVEPDVEVIPAYAPTPLRWMWRVDDFCYRLKLPHVLDLLLVGLPLLAVVLFFVLG